jgi:hypothetical protein
MKAETSLLLLIIGVAVLLSMIVFVAKNNENFDGGCPNGMKMYNNTCYTCRKVSDACTCQAAVCTDQLCRIPILKCI